MDINASDVWMAWIDALDLLRRHGIDHELTRRTLDAMHYKTEQIYPAGTSLGAALKNYDRYAVAEAILALSRKLACDRSAAENITKLRLIALVEKTRTGNTDSGGVDYSEPDEVDRALDMAGAPTVEFSLYLEAPQRIDRLASKIQSLERALERERDDYRKLAMAKAAR